MRAQILLQRGSAAGVARVEEEILQIYRDEFAGVVQFVGVRAAIHLAVDGFPRAAPADRLRPAGQVEQARIVGECETPFALAATVVGQPDRPETGGQAATAALLAPLGGGPQAGAIVQMGEFVQHGGQQLAAQRAVRPASVFAGGRAVEQRRQQAAVERQAAVTGQAPVDVRRQFAPAHLDRTIQSFAETRRQDGQRLVEQCLTGLALRRVERAAVELQAQLGLHGAAPAQQQDPEQNRAHGKSPRTRNGRRAEH